MAVNREAPSRKWVIDLADSDSFWRCIEESDVVARYPRLITETNFLRHLQSAGAASTCGFHQHSDWRLNRTGGRFSSNWYVYVSRGELLCPVEEPLWGGSSIYEHQGRARAHRVCRATWAYNGRVSRSPFLNVLFFYAGNVFPVPRFWGKFCVVPQSPLVRAHLRWSQSWRALQHLCRQVAYIFYLLRPIRMLKSFITIARSCCGQSK